MKAELRYSTAGGTLLSTAALLSGHDLLRTVLLAALGALVSFTVSRLLQRWFKK